MGEIHPTLNGLGSACPHEGMQPLQVSFTDLWSEAGLGFRTGPEDQLGTLYTRPVPLGRSSQLFVSHGSSKPRKPLPGKGIW